ncbi:MAG TPA: hypothetical protein VM243_01365 [Phycisphaerae bacterium]|nr:hypothetical protein [Phycisphaerae bacterium]
MLLEARSPADRSRAIKRAGDAVEGRPDRTLIVALVDRLDDEDESVRFFAIGELGRLTGQRMGYRAHDPARIRRVAVDRWRRHLESGEAAVPSASE